MEPKLKHYGGLNGLTGSKDPVINRNQDTACPGKFKWGANIMEMCAHPCYFLPKLMLMLDVIVFPIVLFNLILAGIYLKISLMHFNVKL